MLLVKAAILFATGENLTVPLLTVGKKVLIISPELLIKSPLQWPPAHLKPIAPIYKSLDWLLTL